MASTIESQEGFEELAGALMAQLTPLQRTTVEVATFLAGVEGFEAQAKIAEMQATAARERQEALLLVKAYAEGVIDGKNEGWRQAQIGAMLATDSAYMQLVQHANQSAEDYMAAKVSSRFLTNMLKVAMEAVREEVARAKPE